MTPSSSSLLTAYGWLFARHLPLRSIDFDNLWVDLYGQGPDRCGDYVNVFSAKAPQLSLKLWRTRACIHGNDFIWRFGVRTLGTHFEWICLLFDVIVVHPVVDFSR